MPDHRKRLNQQQFGAHAVKFVTSAAHARGYSLHRLVELLDPQPSWRIADIATGGGHTALALAARVREVFACDLTYPMLVAARRHIQSRDRHNIYCVQADAEHLPFANEALDCVTCRIAPHHFSDAARFVQEAARILSPGGVLSVADNITSGEPKIAQFANILDKLRDPSHHWAYSLDDWETFFFSADLQVTHRETFLKETDFDEWAYRVGVTGSDLLRLRALLTQAPQDARAWFSPRQAGNRLLFDITETVIIGVKRA